MKGRIAVFASGGGTNLQALLDHFNGGPASDAATVELVVCDREAGALDRAERAGVASELIPVKGREAADVAGDTLAVLGDHGVNMVALAGYLRLIPGAVVEAFRWRMLNVHPALLPAFGGKGMWGHHVHEAVVESGARLSGVTVHYVDERYDTGAILAQWPVPVLTDDDPDTLAARVLRVEHVLYPAAVERVARALEGEGSGVSAPQVRMGHLPDAVAFGLTDAPSPNDVRRTLGLAPQD